MQYLIIGLVLISSTAFANSTSSMRCNNGIISLGATKQETISMCGEPSFKDSYQEPINKYGATITIDQWTYDFGPSQFVYITYFQSGKLVKIESTNNWGTSKQ